MQSQRGPVCLADFGVHFKRSLDKNARDYFSSGANQEQTLNDNVQAFSRYSIFKNQASATGQVHLKISIYMAEMCD